MTITNGLQSLVNGSQSVCWTVTQHCCLPLAEQRTLLFVVSAPVHWGVKWCPPQQSSYVSSAQRLLPAVHGGSCTYSCRAEVCKALSHTSNGSCEVVMWDG